MASKYKISIHKFRTKHNKLEQKDPTSIINITYNLQSCYLFNNESIFLGFSILGFIWFLQTKSEIKTDLTKNWTLKPKSNHKEKESNETQIRLERKNLETQIRSERELIGLIAKSKRFETNQTQQPSGGLELRWGFAEKTQREGDWHSRIELRERWLPPSNNSRIVTGEKRWATKLGGRPWAKLGKELLGAGLERVCERFKL